MSPTASVGNGVGETEIFFGDKAKARLGSKYTVKARPGGNHESLHQAPDQVEPQQLQGSSEFTGLPELVYEVGVRHNNALGVPRAAGGVLYDGWVRELGLMWSLGLRVWGLGCRVWVWGLWLRVEI